ncbi:MAG: ISL3 family transposase [Ruminiclostridium sp.]|nr:ISL3 family transposase [Ruminiclostridium sp.]
MEKVAMLFANNINVIYESQGYEAAALNFREDGASSVAVFKSSRRTKEVSCPKCNGSVQIHDVFTNTLRDAPIWPGVKQELLFSGYRYRCKNCGHTFHEELAMRYPGTRISQRAACWIASLLKQKMTVKSIQEVTGIHWETIRKIQTEYIDEKLNAREQERKEAGYKPKLLAVDEFAIHKGHSYATCVMDLDTGEVLWVGEGRTIKAFERFFENTDPSLLNTVMAVAMDMNASYSTVVKRHMPHVEIVYDRYHLQAQYGRDVLGAVRLEEARKHKASSAEWKEKATAADLAEKRVMREKAAEESREYTRLKNLRWTLLRNGNSLSDDGRIYMQRILDEHHDLAVCYAMKEEMVKLFDLRDQNEAQEKWIAWFEAAKASGIPALERFARLKEKRLQGLIAHAIFPVSTGRLEGFNNKIKVAKRIGYGFRNEEYFFSLIRFLSLPSVRSSPTFP